MSNQSDYYAITIDEPEDFEINPKKLKYDDEIIVEPFVSKTLERIIYDEKTTIITMCMIKESDPLNPIPMSVNQNIYIILKIKNFYNCDDMDGLTWEILDGLQYIFESEHNYSNTSYYHDIFDHLIKTNSIESLHNKKHGKYVFWDDYEDYILLFSINYTPTIFNIKNEDNKLNEIIFNWI